MYVCMYVHTYAGGADYASVPHFADFPPGGMSSLPLSISIIDDNIFEANETIILVIGPTSHPRVSAQPGCMLVITIVDNDGEE